MTHQLYNTLLCFFVLLLVISSSTLKAQCPTVSCPSLLTLTNCTSLGQTVVATSNYSNNISSQWLGPNNAWLSTLPEIPIASIGTSTSTALLNHPGTYTVEFKDNSSSCVVTKTISVTSTSFVPVFNLTSSSYVHCVGATNLFNITNAMSSNTALPFPTTAFSSTFLPPGITNTLMPISILSSASSYTSNLCGPHIFVVKDNGSFCISSFDVAVTCNTNTPIPIIISGTNSVCLGSSSNFTASGANSYAWNTGALTSTCSILSNSNTLVTVSGIDANGCNTSAAVTLSVNNSCADVWPGDANRDGQVDNTDVLELGLAASSTGPARTSTSNAWAAQFANAWTGTISTGWNKCHADCNGDGVVNSNDNVAISANFSLTHTFKGSAAAGTDIQIVASGVANAGRWNVADIVLGSSTNPLSQLYGVAFDLNFDQSIIQNDSIKVVYTSSFLNASNTNIDFQKAYFTNGKSYCATVRTNNSNVNGTGKIAEVYYKVKTGLPTNSILNLSAGNAKMISAGGVLSNLTAGAPVSLTVDNNPSGIASSVLLNSTVRFYPNPASNSVKLENDLSGNTAFGIYDISGRLILAGEFTGSKTIDISKLQAGTYLIEFSSINGKVSKKLVVE